MTLFLSGMAMVLLPRSNDRRKDAELANLGDDPVKVFRIDEKPVMKQKAYSGKATLVGCIDSAGASHSFRLTMLLYFENDSLAGKLTTGDLVMARCQLEGIDGPLNPGTFNFRQYLFNRHIRWQGYLKKEEWEVIEGYYIDGILRWSELCRTRFREILERYQISGEELGLASALILGTRDLLDKEMMQEFSNAGAIHVLSVSGLHVGIMYVLADRILFILKRGRQGHKLHQVIIILIIWAYAFITGLPSSVVRASMMFSLIAAGKMLNRSHESFNILAGALIIQLWISPLEITQVGFQLSYLAVLGIFAFYQQFNLLLADSKKAIAWIWSIFAVSIAAQLATFPLASYYFKFFPVYFLVTNIVVVPLAGVVVYLALVVLVAGLMSVPYTWIGLPLQWSLQLMHGSVGFIQSWPGAVLKPVNLTLLQVALIFLLIIGLFLFINLNEKKGLWLMISSLTLVFFIGGWEKYKKSGYSEIFVYAVSGYTAIDFISNRQAFFIGDSALLASSAKIDAQVTPNRIRRGVKRIKTHDIADAPGNAMVEVFMKFPFVAFGNSSLAIIDQNWKFTTGNEKLSVDLAIICGKKGPRPEKVLAALDIDKVVISSSVPRYMAELWESACKEKGLQCHSVMQAGAFESVW